MKTPLTVGFLCAFAIFSIVVKSDLRQEKSPLEKLKVGEPMPDFTLMDRAGQPVKLSETVAQHKLVMINFWASWCAPCRVEMPGFERLYTSKNKDGFVILGVNEDEDLLKADAYLEERPVTFPILFDPGNATMKEFGVRALPTTVLVGGDGKIRAVFEGIQEYVDFMVDAELKARPVNQ